MSMAQAKAYSLYKLQDTGTQSDLINPWNDKTSFCGRQWRGEKKGRKLNNESWFPSVKERGLTGKSITSPHTSTQVCICLLQLSLYKQNVTNNFSVEVGEFLKGFSLPLVQRLHLFLSLREISHP